MIGSNNCDLWVGIMFIINVGSVFGCNKFSGVIDFKLIRIWWRVRYYVVGYTGVFFKVRICGYDINYWGISGGFFRDRRCVDGLIKFWSIVIYVIYY